MTPSVPNPKRPLSRIFAIPFAIGVVSAIGLVAALVGDDMWDTIGWLGLGIPAGVAIWFMARPRESRS